MRNEIAAKSEIRRGGTRRLQDRTKKRGRPNRLEAATNSELGRA